MSYSTMYVISCCMSQPYCPLGIFNLCLKFCLSNKRSNLCGEFNATSFWYFVFMRRMFWIPHGCWAKCTVRMLCTHIDAKQFHSLEGVDSSDQIQNVIQKRSENCRKFFPASRRHHNWEPIHQSSTWRTTIDVIGQRGQIMKQEFPSIL